MVAAWRVSTETRTPAAARARITGRMRACSVSGRRWLRRGPGALAADIDDVGTGCRHRDAGRNGRVRVQEVAAVAEAVGRDVEHAHDAGAVEARPAHRGAGYRLALGGGSLAGVCWMTTHLGASPAVQLHNPTAASRRRLPRINQGYKPKVKQSGQSGTPSEIPASPSSSRDQQKARATPAKPGRAPANPAVAAVPDRQPAGRRRRPSRRRHRGAPVLRRRLVHHLADHRLATQHRADLVAGQRLMLQQPARQRGAVPRRSRSGCAAPWHRPGR